MEHTTHFFLGANSGSGFCSLFPQFCRPADHRDLLVLKGGPGCGKSTVMARLGRAMEELGEEVEYLHCSGDPDSLDGIRIPRLGVAAVDGTAPHVVEPRYPAAVDRYVDLGAFYDLEAAKARREEIIHWRDACSAAYRRAYRALSAAREMADEAEALTAEGLDGEKLRRRTEGIIRRELRRHGGGGESRRFLGSLTCRGPVWRFDTVQALCPRIYALVDSAGLAAPMLKQLRRAAAERELRRIVCPDPEHPDRIHHLLLPELGLAFVTSREGMAYDSPAYRRVRVDDMVPAQFYRAHRTRLRFCRRMAGELRREGVAALGEAKAAHDALEAVYRPYVDFAGVDALTAREIERLFAVNEA